MNFLFNLKYLSYFSLDMSALSTKLGYVRTYVRTWILLGGGAFLTAVTESDLLTLDYDKKIAHMPGKCTA